MGNIALPLNPKLYKNVDGSVNTSSLTKLIDCYADESGAISKRWGLDLFKNLSTSESVDGAYWWAEQEWLIVVSGGSIFKITANPSMTEFTVTDVTGSQLLSGRIVTFERSSSALYMANGTNIIKLGLTGTTSAVTGPNIPSAVDSITVLNLRLIAVSTTDGKFYWSDTNDYETFQASSFAEAEVIPDDILAVKRIFKELFLFGSNSIEVWYDNGSALVAQVGAYINSGCGAKNSITLVDSEVYWLDNKRNIVRATASSRQPEVISLPISLELQNLSYVLDGIGNFLNIAGKKFFTIKFGRADKTFVFNIITNEWHEWGYWDTTVADHQDFIGNVYVYCEKWNKHLWGSRNNDGLLYLMQSDVYQDNGNKINSIIRTGHITHSTLTEKVCNRLALRLKRGETSDSTTDFKFSVKWNDNNRGFGNPVELSIGARGDTEFFQEIAPMGRYRSRQYEFSFSENASFILISAEENIEGKDK